MCIHLGTDDGEEEELEEEEEEEEHMSAAQLMGHGGMSLGTGISKFTKYRKLV